MKRLVVTAGICAALAVPVLLGTATAQSGPPSGTLELVQLERETRSGFVDNPPRRRESAGDGFTIRGSVRDTGDRPAGTAQAAFTQTGRRSALGSATFRLSQGQIAIAGVVAGATSVLAITGGTGAYAGATGTATITEGQGRTRFLFSFGG